MKKIYTILALALVLVFVFSACTPAEEPEVEEPEVEEPETEEEEVEEPVEMEPLKIAIVSPSAINDFAFTQSIYDAILALQDIYGEDAIEFDYSESMFIVDDAAAAKTDDVAGALLAGLCACDVHCRRSALFDALHQFRAAACWPRVQIRAGRT